MRRKCLATIKMIVTPKEASEEVGFVVEAPGNNDRAIAIPTDELCIISAHKNTETVNAKLTPRVSSSIRGQLATNKPGIVREARVTYFWMQRIWVTEWAGMGQMFVLDCGR